MSLPEGATFAMGEVEKIKEALDALKKDVHAPKEMTAKVLLFVHREFPKVLYKGTGSKKAIKVADADAEKAARDSGYGDYQHPEPEPEE